MDSSDKFDSSIAEEERIVTINMQEECPEPTRKKIRFANVNQIKNYERLAEIRNQKMIETNPTLFNETDLTVPNTLHFISDRSEEYFITGESKQETQDIISKREKQWEINLEMTNIRHHSTLKLTISKMRRNRTFTVENRSVNGGKARGYRYTFNMVESSLVLRVWVELDSIFKVWKEMEVPMTQNQIVLEFQQFNNEQTDVRVNDFLFHLVLKMPYYRQSHYWLFHEDAAEIQSVELKSIKQEKYFEDSQTNCSNECQLI